MIFGNKEYGYNHIGIVKRKRIIDENEDNWPFRSPSGTPWIYTFSMDIYNVDISHQKMCELRGWDEKYWQTQTEITKDKNYDRFINHIKTTYTEIPI